MTTGKAPMMNGSALSAYTLNYFILLFEQESHPKHIGGRLLSSRILVWVQLPFFRGSRLSGGTNSWRCW
ncbi:MAG TPA: hypothetical protein VFE98_09110 [Candidatus Bathyarchaeia archaeon]|nr:hypothetical protein [Candidatus Bathyarchaeia archaeon]